MRVTTVRGNVITVSDQYVGITTPNGVQTVNLLDISSCTMTMRLTKEGEYLVCLMELNDGVHLGRYDSAYTAGALIAAIMQSYRECMPTTNSLV